MSLQFKKICTICWSDVLYEGTEKLIRCTNCGNDLVLEDFQDELCRMKLAVEESKQAKKDLEAARQEKQEAQERLNQAVLSLARIQDDQSVLSRLFQSVAAGQEDASEKIAVIQSVTEKILQGQGDIFAGMGILSELRDQINAIGMDAAASRAFAGEFMAWFQNIHENDKTLLAQISTQSASLLEQQKLSDEKLDHLEQTAADIQDRIDRFQSQWKVSQLEELQSLYHMAENKQRDRRFDEAEKLYTKVIIKSGLHADAELYWRLLLCHYCVIYEKNDHGEYVPTILNPDLTDPAEMSLRRDLLAHITAEQKGVYEAELAKIDRILDTYRQVKDTRQYDVFISVKQDIDGHNTTDSDIASDLYYFLSSKGLRVFNSRITKPPAGQEYEPNIIAALMSAKVLIVVGTNEDNMNAKWVRNEWSRFQWLQFREKEKNGKSDRLLLCYLAGGMRPNQIPRALNPNRQAISADSLNAKEDLLEALSFLSDQKTRDAGIKAEHPSVYESEAGVIDQITAWLAFGQYDLITEKYRELVGRGLYLNNLQLHLMALCAERKISEIGQIAYSEKDFSQEQIYQLAKKLCRKPEDQRLLQDMLERNRKWRVWRIQQNKKQEEHVKILVFARGAKMAEAAAAGADYVADEEIIRRIREEGWIDFDIVVATPDMMGTVGSLVKILSPARLLPSPREGLVTMDVKGTIARIRSGEIKPKKDPRHYDNIILSAEDVYQEGVRQLLAGQDAQAAETYKKAADMGDPKAQLCYGLMCCAGFGGQPVDEIAAEKWLEKVRSHEHIEDQLGKLLEWSIGEAAGGNAFAQYLTGYMYFEGYGTSRNREEAFKWFYAAADQGFAPAQDQVGLAYDENQGARWDSGEALKWYQKAANQGNVSAMLHVGMMFFLGKGYIQENKQIGLRWIRKAAENGYAKAEKQLGMLYQEGNGVEKDLEKAAYWYDKASIHGDAQAKHLLKGMNQKEVQIKEEPVKKAQAHRSDDGRINDSWEEIFASIRDKTYKEKYQIGDTKLLELEKEGNVEMQLVAFDADELSDGSGKAATTWISKQVLNMPAKMNKWPTASGGWEESDMRDYLKAGLSSQIPGSVSVNMKAVRKWSCVPGKEKSDTVQTIDKLWIPSGREVFHDDSCYETQGVFYQFLCQGEKERIRQRVSGVPVWWWLRTANAMESGSFDAVYSDGTPDRFYASTEGGVVFGFCL